VATKLETTATVEVQLSTKPPQPLTQHDIPKHVVETLVELYLRYMHDKPHALFHEPSLKNAVANGTVSQVVLFSILGLAARYAKYCH
jgi:hypothetical protein